MEREHTVGVGLCEWRDVGLSGRDVRQPFDEQQLSLLHIKASEEASATLQRAARRISRNVRSSDYVLILENECVVVLPGTPLAGGQAVARRIGTLLVDVAYELQILCGAAALTLLQRLRTERAVVVSRDVELIELPRPVEQASQDIDAIPYLAFLSNYPSLRLLQLVPYELALRYCCVPVGTEKGMLTLACNQRLELEAITHFQQVTQHRIFQVRCEAGVIEDVLSYWQRMIPVQTFVSNLIEVGER